MIPLAVCIWAAFTGHPWIAAALALHALLRLARRWGWFL